MTYLLDTDHCVYALKGQGRILDGIQRAGREALAVSVITAAELFHGAHRSNRAAQSLHSVEDFLSGLRIVGLTLPMARRFGETKAQLQAAGTPISDLDLLIAVSAIEEGLVLVTNNTSEFERVPGLSLENWVR